MPATHISKLGVTFEGHPLDTLRYPNAFPKGYTRIKAGMLLLLNVPSASMPSSVRYMPPGPFALLPNWSVRIFYRRRSLGGNHISRCENGPLCRTRNESLFALSAGKGVDLVRFVQSPTSNQHRRFARMTSPKKL